MPTGLLGAAVVFRAVERLLNGKVGVYSEAAGVAQAHYTPGACFGSARVLTGLLRADVAFRAVERLLNGKTGVRWEAAGVAQAHYTSNPAQRYWLIEC